MSNHVYIATSLDGFIATSDGGVEWLDSIPHPEDSDYGYAEFMDGMDAILMGRHTFETVMSFGEWPYTKPVFVASSTLTRLPESVAGKAEVVTGDVRTLLESIHRRGYHNLYIDGGITIQRFLEADLIDELIITRIPILLGSGIPLFGTLSQQRTFTHKKTEVFNDTLVQSHYTRVRAEKHP